MGVSVEMVLSQTFLSWACVVPPDLHAASGGGCHRSTMWCVGTIVY